MTRSIFNRISAIALLAALTINITLCVTRLCAIEPTDAVQFDGKTAYELELPKSAVTTQAFSVAAWVKLSDLNESQGFLGIGQPSEFFTFYYYNQAVRMLVSHTSGKTYAFALAKPPQQDQWTHYCGTYDGQTIRVYCNGKLENETPFVTTLEPTAFDGKTLMLGAAQTDAYRALNGQAADLAMWSRALSAEEVTTLYNDGVQSVSDALLAQWNALTEDGAQLIAQNPEFNAKRRVQVNLLNQKDDGYRGIWYYNQKLENEYVYKYSGGMAVYPANHYPFAIYRPEVDKTFFCYGGTDPEENTLWHEVGVFDHKTGKVSRPTILVDKKTDDAHDNPVMSMDAQGYVWVFSTSHGVGRPSFVHKSVRPYDIDEFQLVQPTKLLNGQTVPMNNFSYVQAWNVPEYGFITFFTTYDRTLVRDFDPETKAQRILALMTSPNGVDWGEWNPLAAIEIGHYQNSRVDVDPEKKDENGRPLVKIGSAFNYHPAVAKGNRGVGLNWRTNLYYIESTDLGKTWHSVVGAPVETPLLNSNNVALVRNYENENLNVYITDLAYDAAGNPIIGYVTSKGFESGPESEPRQFRVAHWTGDTWKYSDVCHVDNNYEYAMFYMEEAHNGVIRMVGSFEDGPQAYNTGGEISQWVSFDNGDSWIKEFQLTENSELNQCFPRRTIDANPGFYALWAEGNGREKSLSNLLFSTKDGRVYALPRHMHEDWQEPILLRQAPSLIKD